MTTIDIAPFSSPGIPETMRDLKAVRSTLRQYLTGFTAPNFVQDFERPQRTYDDETRARAEQ